MVGVPVRVGVGVLVAPPVGVLVGVRVGVGVVVGVGVSVGPMNACGRNRGVGVDGGNAAGAWTATPELLSNVALYIEPIRLGVLGVAKSTILKYPFPVTYAFVPQCVGLP